MITRRSALASMFALPAAVVAIARSEPPTESPLKHDFHPRVMILVHDMQGVLYGRYERVPPEQSERKH